MVNSPATNDWYGRQWAGTPAMACLARGRPKQFIQFFGNRSMFQEALMRLSDPLFDRPIITNAACHFMVLEQLAELRLEADVLLEPTRPDSGPAIAAGAGSPLSGTAMPKGQG